MSEWGPWIEHDGKGCPCKGQIVECNWMRRYDDGVDDIADSGARVFPAEGSSSWRWRLVDGKPMCYDPTSNAIIRYRIRKPRGLTILENLIADLPAPVWPKVDA